MKRTSAFALSLLVALGGCSTSDEIVAGPAVITFLFPECEDLGEDYGSWVVPAHNEATSDFVVERFETAQQSNARDITYDIAKKEDGAPDRVDGFVIPAGDTAYVRVAFLPEDPCEEAVIGDVTITGTVGPSPATIMLLSEARLLPEE